MKTIIKQFFAAACIIAAAAMPLFSKEEKDAVLVDVMSADQPVQSFSDKLTLRTFLRLPIMPIVIKPDVQDDETERQERARERAHLIYLPNLTLDSGVGFQWKWFGASYAREIVNFGDTGEDGKTTATDIRVFVFKRKFMADLLYFNFKGFHLALPSEHDVSVRSPEAKRTNFRYNLYEANLFYVFSDDFSMAAAFDQTERQESWDWSFMAMISVIQYSLSDRTSLIPPADQNAFGGNAGFRSGVFRGIAAGPGFGFTVPWKKYYLTAAGFFGNGYLNRRYTTSSGDVQRHDAFYRINVKAAVGYNGDSFFFGNTFVFNGTANYSGLRIVNNTYTVELFSGIRI